MAGIKLLASTAEITLSAGVAKTIAMIVAPTNQRLIAKRWGVFFDAATMGESVICYLRRLTTAGTMSSLTPTKIGVYSETIQSTAFHTATVEPTYGDIVDVIQIQPVSGADIWIPLTEEVPVPGGGRLGIVCVAPAGVNVIGKIGYEE